MGGYFSHPGFTDAGKTPILKLIRCEKPPAENSKQGGFKFMKSESLLLAAVSLLALTSCADPAPVTAMPDGANMQPPIGTNPPAVAMKAWGMLGEWKTDCSIPDSPSYGGVRYIAQDDGSVIEQEQVDAMPQMNMPARTIQLKISDARIRADGSLEVVTITPANSSVTQLVLVKDDKGRTRAIYNLNLTTDFYTVDKGIRHFPLPGGGSTNSGPTVWQSKCS